MTGLKTVLLKLSGPLQAWGTDSHFEQRHTDTHPSKSGIIGMIAAGLGYGREDDEKLKLLNTVGFAVRVDQAGKLLKDFHTAEKRKDNGDLERNYVTNRYYLQDAVFVVGLCSERDDLIDDIERAVRYPYYPLYLGRRSLPPAADLFLEVTETDALTALKEYPWQASEVYQRKDKSRKLEVFADRWLSDSWKSETARQDVAVSFSQGGRRRFLMRQEGRMIVDAVVPGEPCEHDAFAAVEED